MRNIHGTNDVDFHDPAPIRRLQVPERKPVLTRADGHGKNNVIGAAEGGLDFSGCLLHGRIAGHVAEKGRGPHRVLLANFPRRGGYFGVAIYERDLGPLGGESQGYGPTNAPGPTHDYRDMTTIIRDRIQDMIRKGMTLEQVKAARPTRDYDPQYGANAGTFVEAAYRSLTK